MQFLITAYDFTDSEALSRRMAAREGHLALIETMRQRGEVLYAAAILEDDGKMVGSCLIVEMPSREAVDVWLDKEPYVQGKVWDKIDVKPCKVGASFVGK